VSVEAPTEGATEEARETKPESAAAPSTEAAPRPSKPRNALPVWLRTPPARAREARRPAPTPREIRWWVGVVWLALSALLLGLVAHVAIVGSLQHTRSQQVLYEELRGNLAEAISPLGQLGTDGTLVANGTPVALMTIARLSLSEVIVQGTTPTDLMLGPGHRRDSVFPGQAGTSIIMGRQATYGGPFSALGSLVPGDVIKVTTGQGEQRYKVFSIRRDGDLLPEVLPAGEGRLELISAEGIPLAPSGAIHVDAALETDVVTGPAPVFTSQVLNPSELAMASDPQGWVTTLLWLQWLFIAVVAVRWARSTWGIWQTWIVAVPILLALGAGTANAAMTMLPNLL